MIGEDGNVYEGRGWNTVGGHMPYWNIVSLGIAVMGNFQRGPPQQRSPGGAAWLIGVSGREPQTDAGLQAVRTQRRGPHQLSGKQLL